MRIGYFGAALGSIQQEKQMAVHSNNIANAMKPGYRKDAVHFSNFLQQKTYTKMEQGKIQRTENPLDIAINGEGFLRVRTDAGILYTRAGDLRFSPDRTLVTQDGWPVLGSHGQPIQIPELENQFDIRIERDGQVLDGEDRIGTLAIAQFGQEALLEKVTNGYLRPSRGEERLMAEGEFTIEQGALEAPNFNIVEEMVKIVETTRIFEAYQKVLQSFDQEDSQLVRTLGNL